MPIHMTARWNCRPGSERIVETALREFVAAVDANEPGTSVYTALQTAEDPTAFMTYFIFEDEAARDRHRQTDWVQRFTQTIYPENAAPIVFTEYRLVATTLR